MGTKPGKRDSRRRWLDGGEQRRGLFALALVAPLLLLVAMVVGVSWYCHDLLTDAADGVPTAPTAMPLLVAAGGFLLAAVAATVVQAMRVAHRVAGPEYRLQQAIQRIRSGDLAFRVQLRKGDLLAGLAAECNELIEWLNANPPPGARTGSDLIELEPAAVPAATGEQA